MTIPEDDWKRFKDLKTVALERFCEKVLVECGEVLGNSDRSPHDRYLELSRLMKERDRELAGALDYHSRSKTVMQLIAMRRLNVASGEDLQSFSSKTRNTVEAAVREF
jgi:hypothetical protein